MGSLLDLIYTLPFGLITTEVLVPTLRPISQAQKIHQERSRLASVRSLVSTSRITRETWTLNTPLNPKGLTSSSFDSVTELTSTSASSPISPRLRKQKL